MMPQSLEVHRVADISGLTYNAIGHGENSLVAVNALGQGIALWLPLLERLSRKLRVVIWEMRSAGSDGRPVTFAEHCQDLYAIVQQEGSSRTHLVGWCTGAKLAARYCRTHSGIRSMVFLSGSFKHVDRAPEFDTAYERNLQAILGAVVRQPSLAERLRVAFAPADDNGDSELQHEARRPFRDAQTFAVYARQHLEFWSHDETTTGSEVRVPILGIAGEHDEIISPAAFRAALNKFPSARYVEIPGATHHCFYELPDTVADLIEDFLA
jgi:pimeloyl-ACP methyl ester carboxylesterase